MTNRHLMTLLGMMMSATAFANHPDSVYVRPDIEQGAHSMYIAYSQDKKHWKRLDCALFDGDYGSWGSQKKIFYPVLSYDGKMFHATFFPAPDYLTDNAHNIRTKEKYGQIAVTESKDMRLWKPQDYPFIPEAEYRQRLEQQKANSANNIITIPYSTLKGLQHMAERKSLEAQWSAEDYVATAKPIAEQADSITMKMKIDMDDTKAISPNLIGVFFEDISYAADGGLYAELIQNRDFEYSEKDHQGWSAMTAWELKGEGSTVRIENTDGISKNNSHYAVISTTTPGAQLVNNGWDGIVVKAKAKYLLSLFVKGGGSVRVSLISEGKTLATTTLIATDEWKQKKVNFTASADASNAQLVIEPLQPGELSVDFVSLFPKDTFKGHENGLRKDLAQTIADLHPRFVRFPGGCASHGNGIDNIYHWKATVGALWDRQPDFNIWNYHQTRGLGFYEYFQFCEDIGAEPLPVLSSGVPCQNSWTGGNGQNGGLPWASQIENGKLKIENGQGTIENGQLKIENSGEVLTMEAYLQELLDLIDWANGDAKTNKWAAMRAKAGHPKPFNLKYFGVGNEDLLNDTCMTRYLYLVNGIKKAHPEITVVGTVGPFWEGSDYEYGWRAAKENNLEIVDEHYYNSPGWFFHHRNFYDDYDRNGTKVYLGEWASHGAMTSNGLIEAAYLTNVERNADVVCMSSYAPLLAKEKHRSWNPDMIYFDNESIRPAASYYVQRIFGQNSGDRYVYSDIIVDYKNLAPVGRGKDAKPLLRDISNRIDKSVVVDSKTGDVIIKIVSMLPKTTKAEIALPESVVTKGMKRTITTLAAGEDPNHSSEWHQDVTTSSDVMPGSSSMAIDLPAWSITCIRFHK